MRWMLAERLAEENAGFTMVSPKMLIPNKTATYLLYLSKNNFENKDQFLDEHRRIIRFELAVR